MTIEQLKKVIKNWEEMEIIKSIGDAISIQDTNFKILFQNKISKDIVGDHVGEYCYRAYEQRDYICEGCPVAKVFRDGEIHKTERNVPTDRGIEYFEITASPLKDSTGKIMAGVEVGRNITECRLMEEKLRKAHDELEIHVEERTSELLKAHKEILAEIIERKKIEKKLQGSKGRFKRLSEEFNALLDAIPDNLVLLSPEMKIMWANKTAAVEFGRDISELKGQYCYKLCCGISSPCENCPTLRSLRTKREENTQVTTSEGRFWDIRAFPIKDEHGNIKNIIEVARDITTKIHMEEKDRLIQAKLIHANKMTSLGTLVSGIAHEINNPNSFIMSNAQLLSEVWKDAVQILTEYYLKNGNLSLGGLSYSEVFKVMPKLLNGINEGSIRIKSIIDNLKDFARPDRANMDGKINVNEVVTVSRSILVSQVENFTDNFNILCRKSIPPVRGSSQQIEQVIINLIMNSLQSLPDKNCGVWVSTSFNKKSKHVVIQIKDEGTGMSKDVLERVTEPFFTTKLDSGGTGLGLFISYAIIKEHNGFLEFKSSPNKGTVATIRLPVYPSKGKVMRNISKKSLIKTKNS